MTSQLDIQIWHSPDADDRFMFWPLRAGHVSSSHYAFCFHEADTQGLNRQAATGAPDICAISAIRYANLWRSWQPMKMGFSVGDGYGPVVVALKGKQRVLEGGAGYRLLTPGLSTTAHATVMALGHTFGALEEVPIVPMEQVFDRLNALENQGVAAVALLIHEGRLMYGSHGCEKLLDLGEAWKARTGGSLPLGMNVMNRRLDRKVREELADLCHQSCLWALNHKDLFLDLAADPSTPWYSPLSRGELSHYLDLYANATTLSLSDQDASAFSALVVEEWKRQGDVPSPTEDRIDWI